MKNWPIYLSAILIACMIYVIITIIFFLRFKVILKNADLNTYKKILGTNYVFREHHSGWTKYKWQLMTMTIKASFDEQGQLQEWQIRLFNFFGYVYQGSIA